MLCGYDLDINATIFPAKLLHVFLDALVGAFLTNFGYFSEKTRAYSQHLYIQNP